MHQIMSEELLINVTPQETRIATLENGMLNEVRIERTNKRGLVGNIYKGKVARVLPGMDAAFIEIGLERAAFLHVSDLAQTPEPSDHEERPKPISEFLRDGQEIMVQVIKDPLGSKGARLTTRLSLPSRLLVYMPHEAVVGISTKIEDDQTRDRLRSAAQSLIEQDDHQGGFIVRTAAEDVTEEQLHRDAQFLIRLWNSIDARAGRASHSSLIHEDLPLVLRTLRDAHEPHLERIRIDSRETLQKAKDFCRDYLPEVGDRLEHYPGERPIFDLYGVEDELLKALDKTVPLKSGGYLVIDQTESMTTVDVNTGAFVGHRNLEETIFKTNLEAAQSLVRQLRLRNLGGIIIIDFIDMLVEEHKRQVMRALEKALERDHAKTQVCSVSSLGLVEMTRKRTRESLEQVLCEFCPICGGRGKIRTAETVCYEISREIIRQVRQFEVSSLTVIAAQSVVDLFLGEQSDNFAELETFIGVPIRLRGESMYGQEQYDVVMI